MPSCFSTPIANTANKVPFSQHTISSTAGNNASFTFPNLKNLVEDISVTPKSILDLLFTNSKVATEAITEKLQGHFLKEVLVPYLLEKYHKELTNVASEIVVHCDISQNTYQSVFRSMISPQLKNIFGNNIFPTKADVFSNVQNVQDSLINQLG